MRYPIDAVCQCDADCKGHASKMVCESRVWAKNLCRTCYCRQRRHGLGRFARRELCSRSGCSNVEYARGLCNAHYVKSARDSSALAPR